MKESDYNWMVTYTGCKSRACFDLIDFVGAGESVRFVDCVFDQPVFLQTKTIARSWRFVNCKFTKPFDATDAKFESALTFRDCIFVQSITLRNTEIGGTFDFTGSTVLLPNKDSIPEPDHLVQLFDPPPDERSAKWERLRVKGDLIAECTGFLGSLNLGESRIDGKCSFRGTVIGAFPKKQFRDDSEAIVGALRATPHSIRRKVLSERFQFCGRFYLRGSTINGDFDLSPAPRRHVPQGKNEEVVSAGERHYRRTELFGSLSIGLSHFHGRLNLRGTKIEGATIPRRTSDPRRLATAGRLVAARFRGARHRRSRDRLAPHRLPRTTRTSRLHRQLGGALPSGSRFERRHPCICPRTGLLEIFVAFATRILA